MLNIKKTYYAIMLLTLVEFMSSETHAKTYSAPELPLVVKIMPEWSNEYPTVTNNWEGMLSQTMSGEIPPLLSVITALNGKDTRGMSETEFYELLMSSNRSTIDYQIKKNGINTKQQCTIQYHQNIYWAEGLHLTSPADFPQDVTVKCLRNASAFSFNTFGYQLNSLDVINEQAVLEAAGKSLSKLGFSKVEADKNPDMVLCLSLGRDKYNAHMVTLTIMDGKRLRDGQERPLWTIDITNLRENLKSQESTIKTLLNQMCINFPFDQPTYSQSIYTLGIAFDNEESVPTGRILEVMKGSDAYEKGLRGGDVITKAFSGGAFYLYRYHTRRTYFKANHKNRHKNWGVDLAFLVLPIIPHYNYNNAYHYLIDDNIRGEGKTNRFKVKSPYGQEKEMYAPFETRQIYLKYIR